MNEIVRCFWAEKPPIMQQYHDEEWGVPQHNDNVHFELITLEGAQAGLSWLTVLNKREGYRTAFHGFDPHLVSQMTESDVEQLMLEPGIIRNRAKIIATIGNARAFLKVQDEFGSFDQYIWQFVDGKPLVGCRNNGDQIVPKTALSDTLSKDLLSRGFKFVGSTIVYAYMQATGLVDDHLSSCFRSPHSPVR